MSNLGTVLSENNLLSFQDPQTVSSPTSALQIQRDPKSLDVLASSSAPSLSLVSLSIPTNLDPKTHDFHLPLANILNSLYFGHTGQPSSSLPSTLPSDLSAPIPRPLDPRGRTLTTL